ncbi:MAG: hypothetical protein PVH29_05805 [Candidatus Zixiibacteriota bacterium]|jgi:hypothetical protein
MGKVIALCALAVAALSGPARCADIEAADGRIYINPTSYELKWDNGTLGSAGVHGAAGTWIGNEFDTSTLAAKTVKTIRFYSCDNWPNSQWDGFNVAIFLFRNGVPTNMLWGPRFVIGEGTEYNWCDATVDFELPKWSDHFVAAAEQIYAQPDADPYCLDTAPSRRRTWKRAQSIWQLFPAETNLMLRVVMEGEIGIEPVSMGRVKALYY